MGVTELKNLELLYVTDERGAVAAGGNQYWYPKGDFVPGAACGSATASNIVAYILRSRPCLYGAAKTAGLDGLALPLSETEEGGAGRDTNDKAGYLEFMKKIYRLFTPGILGLHTSGFLKGARRLAAEYGIPLSAKRLKVPVKVLKRPAFLEAAEFIRAALSEEGPAAFLVLSTAGVSNLYKWHWVSIIGLDEENERVRILDNNVTSWVDLGSWLRKSFLGGAIIRLMQI